MMVLYLDWNSCPKYMKEDFGPLTKADEKRAYEFNQEKRVTKVGRLIVKEIVGG